MLKSSKSFQKDNFVYIWAIRTNEDHLRSAQGKMLKMSPS